MEENKRLAYLIDIKTIATGECKHPSPVFCSLTDPFALTVPSISMKAFFAFTLLGSRLLEAPFTFILPVSRLLDTRLPCFWQVSCLVWAQLWGSFDCIPNPMFCAVQHDDIAACIVCDLCILTGEWRELLLLLRHQDKISLQSAFHVTVCLSVGPAVFRSQVPDPHGRALNVQHL